MARQNRILCNRNFSFSHYFILSTPVELALAMIYVILLCVIGFYLKLCVDLIIGASCVSHNIIALKIKSFHQNFLISEQHFKDFEIQNALVDLFSDIGTFTSMDVSESSTKATL